MYKKYTKNFGFYTKEVRTLQQLNLITMRKAFYLLTICLMFASCIEEYTISNKDIADFEPQLVINGKILSGDKTIIHVTRTQAITSTDRQETVLNAEITLVGQNGYTSPKAEFDIENDRYVIPTYDLPKNTLYAIEAKIEGETYMSEFQPILQTPEIDNVNYREKEDGIGLYVSTHGEEDDSRHFMWTYDEDWEFHAEVDISKQPVKGEWVYYTSFYPLISENKNPYLHCWMHNESAFIHIYTTENLTANEVKDQEFLFIPIDDIRISYLYSILVKQASLSEDGYEYYRLMKLYTQESNGIFSPIPSEVKGNIKCISNPEKTVYGYVMASDITTKRLFIHASDFKNISSQYTVCEPSYGYKQNQTVTGGWKNAWQQEIKYSAGVIYNENAGTIENSSILYSRTCVNCLTIEGATKKRPDFWPNNHE